MKKLFLFLFLISCSPILLFAQNATELLDRTLDRIKTMDSLRIEFTSSVIEDGQTMGQTSGAMNISGRKFALRSADMLVWFDGRQLYAMQPGAQEVNLTEPTAQELQALNPYTILQMYKHGFKAKMKTGKMLNGKQGYRITLTATNANTKIREMFVEVDKQYNLTRVSLKQGGDQWTRIVVNSINGGQKFAEADFTFPSKDFPKAEVIDLR